MYDMYFYTSHTLYQNSLSLIFVDRGYLLKYPKRIEIAANIIMLKHNLFMLGRVWIYKNWKYTSKDEKIPHMMWAYLQRCENNLVDVKTPQ